MGPNETTHFSIADQFGNVISNTYTLNSAYGSGVTISGTGILMNNEMDDFSGVTVSPINLILLEVLPMRLFQKKPFGNQ